MLQACNLEMIIRLYLLTVETLGYDANQPSVIPIHITGNTQCEDSIIAEWALG
jgi:hypothetical protein